MFNLRNVLRAARARRATYADLIRLDERSLEDIGFNRADVDIRWG
ncbi:DUF1127 domain-containing protein [Jannaschia formosa]|nr:DUF1127 domain-containing protein [Jannaschia formosa]TFL19156.1 DUF1127 domain-containing protein [Jannaschia formosa]